MAEIDLDALKDSLVRREVSVGREPPTAVPREHLETMAAAADEVLECLRVLDKGGIRRATTWSPLWSCLRARQWT